MNTQELAHKILVDARGMYEATGWCQGSVVAEGGQRCLNGALNFAIMRNCAVDLDSLYDNMNADETLDTLYPEQFQPGLLASDYEAVKLATKNLARECFELFPFEVDEDEAFWEEADIADDQGTIISFNDSLDTIREDILLALDKAIANT